MTGKSLLAALLFSFATLAKLTAQCDCITTGNCPVALVDQGVFTAFLDVTVNGPNDLAQSPLQQVCMTISHSWIGDLSVSLVSPSGVEYLIMSDAGNDYQECGTQQDNAEVCITLGTNHPLTNNTEYVCNSAPCSVGSCCLNGNWTVPCGGVTSPITGAIQAPNCDLNDYNVPGQPANGTWTLRILDACTNDSGNLENFSLTFAGGQSCYACEADGGALDTISVVSCLGDSDLMLGIMPHYPNGPLFGADAPLYGYIYLITQGGIVIAEQNNPDLTSFPVGNYQVYGLSYLVSHAAQVPSLVGMNINSAIALLSSATAPFCGNISSNNVPVTILPTIPARNISGTICQGDTYTIGTTQFNSSGNHTVVLNSFHGCDSTINLALTVIQPDTVDVVRDVCTGGCVTIGGQSYCAPAPQYIHLTNWQGCDSVVHLTFIVHAPTATITPANPPSITCSNSSVALSAASSGPGTLTYAWSGPAGFSGSTQANINATIPGTYTVTVSDNAVTPACTSTASVTVANGVVQPDLILSGTAPSICQGQTFNLGSLTVIDQNSTGGTITYHSGTPANAGNQLSNPVVSPSATTTYYVKSTTGNCSDELPVIVTVNPVPTATFTATPSPSCINNNVTVTYTGSAVAGATYNWTFGGGTVVSGTGAGPYQIDYSSPGAKTITLTVTQNGCTSTQVSQNIQVDDALDAIVINCNPTTDSINFTWNADPNVSSYTVTSNVPGVHASPTATSYQVSNLMPGQTVTITVTATGNTACGSVSATQSCTAQSCPTGLAVSLGADTTICRNGSTMPFNLQATVSGELGGGIFTYSGPGITNASLGTFNPATANLGANTINVNYNENGCQVNDSKVINVFQPPTAGLTAPSKVCRLGLGATVTFNGPTAGLNFTWNFGGGFGSPGFGGGPQNVTWPSAGPKTITVTVSDGTGCQATASTTVIVEEPLPPLVPTCTQTLNSVTLTWPHLTDTTLYNLVVSSGQVATQLSDTSYVVNNLIPGEEVDFTVTAFNSNSCGNQVANITCAAVDCPPILLTVDPVDDICLDAMSPTVQLVTRLGSTIPVNQTEYFGTGVTLSGLFDPKIAGPGTHTIIARYTNGPCTKDIDHVIHVYDKPTGDFTAPATVCQGNPATVALVGNAQANLTYTWDFGGGTATPGTGAGPHTVTWDTPGQKFITLTVENQQGCMSPIYAKMVTVNPPVAAPQPTCNTATTTSIEFNWPSVPGASGYQITTPTGQTVTQTSTTWTASGLQPSEQVCVTIASLSGSSCPGDSATVCCNALPCPSITVDVASLTDYCLGTSTPEQLQVTVTGSNGTGTGNWSGPGVLNGGTGTFNASAAGFGQHTITYTFVEESCTYKDSITFGVYQQPTATFNADAGICLSESATVAFGGQFSPTATYTWDFDGGTAVPGTGVGPHQVTWPTTGQKNITLSVTDGSCSSPTTAQQVQVDDQLAAPTIVCSATTDGVVFSWNTVPGATDYTATGTGGVQTSNTTFTFTGLNPNQQVSMSLTVNGNTTCPLPVVTSTCSSQPCPQLSLAVAPVSPICLVAGTPTVPLVGNVNGIGIGTGIKVWSGPGIVDATQGIFDPNVAGVGLHVVTCFYQQLNCTYQGQTAIEVVAQPTADAGPDRLITCWESDQEVQLGGPLTTSSNNVSRLWTAASGSFPGDATARYPTVSEAGLYTLTVTNTALGCSDSDDVLVISTKSTLEPAVGLEPINCGHNGKDANMTVTNVTGGTEPYLYSLNGEPFVSENVFAFLEAGEYDLTVMDAEGCTGTTKFTVDEAGTVDVELTANIIGQPMVAYGESISLTALTSLPESELDSIHWTHGEYLSCSDCLDPVATPLAQSTFVVTLFKGNCSATDSLNVFVDFGEGNVYVPSAFSPNGDGHNDKFMVYAGPMVKRIKTFLVFDRWGERVYEYSDFDPSDPARGWDGILDGQPMNPAVYVWFAEVEFQDGSVEVLEGDVTLVR